ncbi:LysR family transcriptional regulator [Ramlibacter sp. MAHUQ-53]|uniref:LysR family transcriptional regulator n=1 Tax=unclassified Ramlibacter TaxID=2617605 RepID=UPI003631DB85
MDASSLTLLVEILDAGNLSEAARRLKMTRANVSYHLAQLEKRVGAQLLRRTSRQVEPTELGRRLYEHGRVMRDEIRAAQETISTLGTGLGGRVGLSMPSGYGQMVMSPWLIEFKRAYPRIVLEARFENRVDDLIRDDVDIAIRILHEPPQNLIARELGPVRYVLCAARAYAQAHGRPQALGDLRQVPLITSPGGQRELRLRSTREAASEEVVLEPALTSEHYPFLEQAIRAGLGWGLVPDYVVREGLASGDIVRALEDHTLRMFGPRMYLMYLPNRYQTRAVRTCIDFLLARHGVGGEAPR